MSLYYYICQMHACNVCDACHACFITKIQNFKLNHLNKKPKTLTKTYLNCMQKKIIILAVKVWRVCAIRIFNDMGIWATACSSPANNNNGAHAVLMDVELLPTSTAFPIRMIESIVVALGERDLSQVYAKRAPAEPCCFYTLRCPPHNRLRVLRCAFLLVAHMPNYGRRTIGIKFLATFIYQWTNRTNNGRTMPWTCNTCHLRPFL